MAVLLQEIISSWLLAIFGLGALLIAIGAMLLFSSRLAEKREEAMQRRRVVLASLTLWRKRSNGRIPKEHERRPDAGMRESPARLLGGR